MIQLKRLYTLSLHFTHSFQGSLLISILSKNHQLTSEPLVYYADALFHTQQYRRARVCNFAKKAYNIDYLQTSVYTL